MTNEYDKARNPEPKQTPLRLLSDDEYHGILKRLDSLDLLINSHDSRILALDAVVKLEKVKYIPPTPAQNPLFDTKPSEAWKDTGENLEPVIQLSDVMDKLDRHSTTLELINDSIVLLTNVINRNAAAKPTIKEAE